MRISDWSSDVCSSDLMTPQVARIATTRLKKAPRPLRLCYGGQVLQVRGSQLRPERQFAQAGVELIGAPEESADAEAVLLAIEALNAVGVRELSVDLTPPPLVSALAGELGLAAAQVAGLRLATLGRASCRERGCREVENQAGSG